MTASPALLALIQGKFALGHVTLLRPNLSGKIATNKDSAPKQKTEDAPSLVDQIKSTPITLPIHPILHGCDLQILHGFVNVEQDNNKFILEDIEAEVDVSLGGILDANLNLGTSALLENDKIFTKLDALYLSVAGLSSKDEDDDISFRLNTRVHMANTLQAMNIDLNLTLNPTVIFATDDEDELPYVEQNLSGSWSIIGDILWHNQPITVINHGELSGNLSSLLKLTNVTAQLGNDKLSLDANIYSALGQDPSIAGEVKLQNLNLTQWFGFARQLPPGLQQTLQGIVNGNLIFKIDKQGLYATHIEASATNTRFIGTGGVSSWDDIIIKLDLAAQELSLVQAFPETEGHPAFAPSFEHEPLTPVPGSPAAQSMSGPSVGYDINLSVNKLTTWGLTLEGVDFRCIPTEQDEKSNPKNHPNAVLLDFNVEKFYNGRAKAKAVLFRTEQKKSGYDITAILRNVRSQDPLSILAGREIFGGRLSLDTSFIAYGKNLGEFLISKVGELSLGVEDGFFTSKAKERTPFDKFNVAGKFTSKPLTTKMINNMPETLRYTGLWRAELERPDMHFDSNLNGVVTLVGRNYTDIVFDKIKGQLQTTLTKDLIGLKQDMLADIDGKYSFDSTKSIFSIIEGDIIVPNFANTKLHGDIDIDYANELLWEANIKGKTENFSVFAEKLSADTNSPIVKSAPQILNLKAKISNKNKQLNITDLELKLDKMLLTGSLHKIPSKAKPLWDINLKLNMLDWDGLFPPKPKVQKIDAATAANPNTAPSAPPKNWSLDWLRENEAKGSIHIDILRLYKTTSTNIKIPISIKDNIIKLSPITGNFYGGPAKVDFMGKGVGDVLRIQGGLSAENINMLQLSHELKLETAIAGTASIWLSMQGDLNNSNTILPVIDGTWRAKVVDGFLQTREEDGTLSGDRTVFHELQDAGPLSKGILYSKNLILKGPTLSLTGQGNINLVQDTLDMHLLVNTSGLENIPVHYHGSLDDPQEDIDTGSVIFGTIANLGTGIFDLIGGAFGGLFSLFK